MLQRYYFNMLLTLLSTSLCLATTERFTPQFVNKTGGDITLYYWYAKDFPAGVIRHHGIRNGERISLPLVLDSAILNNTIQPREFAAKGIGADVLYLLQVAYGPLVAGIKQYNIDLKIIHGAYKNCRADTTVEVEFNQVPSSSTTFQAPFKIACKAAEPVSKSQQLLPPAPSAAQTTAIVRYVQDGRIVQDQINLNDDEPITLETYADLIKNAGKGTRFVLTRVVTQVGGKQTSHYFEPAALQKAIAGQATQKNPLNNEPIVKMEAVIFDPATNSFKSEEAAKISH